MNPAKELLGSHADWQDFSKMSKRLEEILRNPAKIFVFHVTFYKQDSLQSSDFLVFLSQAEFEPGFISKST